jgi:predicted HTH domain antitoxin
MSEKNIEKTLSLIKKVLGDYDYTSIEKAILILLYLYNDKVDVFRLHKMVFLASLDIDKLKEEMEPIPRMYKDIFYDKNVAEAIESLKCGGLIEGDTQFLLSTKGKEIAEDLLKNLSDKERDIYDEIVDLFKGTTDDEILAIFYYKLYDYIKIVKPIRKIGKNRKKLAISLYRKGKISIGAASEIAGMNIKDFMEMLKKKNLI